MKRFPAPILAFALSLPILFACETPPTTPTAAQFVLCPTATPGEPVLQHNIRPPVPAYPNAQNVQVATPVPPAFSLETPTIINGPATLRITRFTTSDNSQQIISFYRDKLTSVGWIELEEATTSNKISFGFSVESTVMAANRANRCAPTVETELPGYTVDIIIGTNDNSTTVEVKEILD